MQTIGKLGFRVVFENFAHVESIFRSYFCDAARRVNASARQAVVRSVDRRTFSATALNYVRVFVCVFLRYAIADTQARSRSRINK